MAEIEVTRTYKIEVDDKSISHIRAMGGSVTDMLKSITHLIDGGDLSGEAAMVYFYDPDAEMGTYEWCGPDDYADDSEHPVVAKVEYRLAQAVRYDV